MKKLGMVAVCIAAVTLSAVAQEARRSRGNRSRVRSRSTALFDQLSSGQLPRNDNEDQLPADQTDLAVRWREAKSSNAKSKIAKVLTTRLDQIFDKDMAQRQRQIDAIEKRLAQLKELYKKREQAKSKIVKLQAQAITMDWEGLGFARSNQRVDRSVLDTEPNPFDNGLVDDQFEVTIEYDAELPSDNTPELDFLPQEEDEPLHEDDLLEEDGTPDDETELPILDGGLGDGGFDDLAPSDESDADVLDDVFGQAPFVDENDDMFSRDQKMLDAIRDKYKERYGKHVASFVQSCTPDPGVQNELGDILLMVARGYFEYPGDTFRGTVMEAYHRSAGLQQRGETIAPKYFERLARITEAKAKQTAPKNRGEYMHLLARLKDAAGDDNKAIKYQRAAVSNKPDNAEYRTFLQRLIKGNPTDPTDTSIVPFQDDV